MSNLHDSLFDTQDYTDWNVSLVGLCHDQLMPLSSMPPFFSNMPPPLARPSASNSLPPLWPSALPTTRDFRGTAATLSHHHATSLRLARPSPPQPLLCPTARIPPTTPNPNPSVATTADDNRRCSGAPTIVLLRYHCPPLSFSTPNPTLLLKSDRSPGRVFVSL
jgi:hypothetical protein